MAENLELQDVAPEDIPHLARIIAAAFEVHRDKLEPPSSSLDKTPESVAVELVTARAIMAVSREEGIGVVFYETREDTVHISRLAVLPEHQGKGVAKMLLGEVEARARAAGTTRARLSVRLTMLETRAFYERLGYQLEGYGRHEGYPEPTLAKLVKDL
jgi:ribosomal protein S18 acetylase RimI-like enzyme